ncbi:MAG: hypothetical protein L3J82_05335 [Planctomycetes bacterium]|nr:hypothetical protein [Planctomycetota bacterium]
MNALFALSISSFLDILRRPATKVIASIGIIAILTLRYFSAFGLGYEVIQLKELAVYTAGLMAIVAAIVFVLPREDEDSSSMLQILTRPVPVWQVSLGLFLGRFAVIGGLIVLWGLAGYAALLWFELADPMMFTYRGADSAFMESLDLATPLLGQWLAAGVFLALLLPASRSRRTVVIAAFGIGIYVVGNTAASLGDVLVRVLPDLSRYDLTEGLWSSGSSSSLLMLIVHAIVWTFIGILMDSLALRSQTS